MARIAGVELPKDKRLEIGLTYLYGVGRPAAKKILEITKLDGAIRIKDLSDGDLSKLREAIEKNLRVEGDLRQEVTENINRLKDIGSYRGTRHKAKLPVRGQRTKTNARSKRGKKQTVGSGRKAGKNEGRI